MGSSSKPKKRIIQSILDGQGNKIYLPPRKKRQYSYCLPLRFVITGTIPSKKNRQIATINHNKIKSVVSKYFKTSSDELYKELKEIKPYIRPAKNYLEWEEAVKQDIVLQAARWATRYKKHNLIFPISKASISIYHYWKDDRERDNSNKAESLHDMFVSAGIITSDAWQNLNPTQAEADLYTQGLSDHITTITITAYF